MPGQTIWTTFYADIVVVGISSDLDEISGHAIHLAIGS